MTELKDIRDIFGDEDASKPPEEIDYIIRQLTMIVESDVRRIYRKDGTMLPVSEWPDNEAKAARKIMHTEKADGSVNVNVDWHDRAAAGRVLAQLKGAFNKDEQIANPLEAAFMRIPRDQLVRLHEELKALQEPAPDPETGDEHH